ncbi:MAG: guanylate kinase [Elusimicrobiota bacterium]
MSSEFKKNADLANRLIKKIRNERSKNGLLVIISAPSGTGKTTLSRLIVEETEKAVRSISFTSRSPGKGEKHDRDYFFLDRKEFKKKIKKGEFLEWAEVHGNYYGTSKNFVESELKKGSYIILDIDIQGGLQIKEKKSEAVLIFLMPPSFQELEKRIKRRKRESVAQINRRLNEAYEEINGAENYDYIVFNDELSEALSEVKSIIRAESLKIKS